MITNFQLNNILILLPEILVILSALVLVVLGVFFKQEKSFFSLMLLALISCVVTFFVILFYQKTGYVFGKMLVNNSFTIFCKELVLIGAICSIILSIGFYKDQRKYIVQEFPSILMFSLAGIMLLVSANDLISLYMSIELQSLAFYVLASINSKEMRSSEAGLKYFITGSVASGLLLYGISFIYGFTGSISFHDLLDLYHSKGFSSGVYIGLSVMLAGLCFKISAVPFHMWTPDVYQGAPTPVTAFFAIVPKVSFIAIICRFLMYPFGNSVLHWQQIIIFASIASMIVSALGALRQIDIKRLLAYSSIGHVGYMLSALAIADVKGIHAILFYLVVYVTMNAGLFACIMMIRNKNGTSTEITTFSGLANNKPFLSLSITILLLSMAGVPPFAGFFAKVFIFNTVIGNGLYYLAIIGVLSSVISVFYYLRIIKIMYFDEVTVPINRELRVELKFIAFLAVIFNTVFFISPVLKLVMNLSRVAVSGIFN